MLVHSSPFAVHWLRHLPRAAALVAAAWACRPACAQWSFTVDPTFQTQIVQQNVNALVILSDGKILASGRIRYSGDQSDRGSSRLLPNGSRDLTFTDFVGGGKLTAWSDQYYVQAGLPRRLFSDGTTDPSFRSPNLSPCRYFNSVQGGDYHVYPDGRVLISGNHQLWDSIRGYVGRHQLIWLTSEGCLDTTRTHRSGGNCAVYRFAELPNGQFICSGLCDQFDGQEIDRIFRVNADGSVDTTFRTGVYAGEAFGYLPLDDGRVYVGGNFRRTEAPLDTLRLVRFLPDGALDPTFSIPQFTAGEGLSTPFGATAYTINAWRNGTLIITSHFKRVNGQVRKGICMIDSTGQLLPAFSGQGVGPFTFSGLTAGSIHRIVFNADSTQMYVCGAYSGYNDGLTNYPQQRFIDCGFTQNAPLNYPDQRLQFHAYLYRSANTRFFGCRFVNELAWNTYLDNPNWWGTGIRSFGSRVRVVDMDNGTQSQFRGLGMGIRVQPLPNTNPAVRVDHALFVDNARGVWLSTVPNARVTSNLFLVPDHDVSVFGGLGATYGTYLDGATGFELEENVYLGSSATGHPKVGAAFKGTGPDNNTYYNNRFDRFRDASVSSAGTIIQANNGNSSPNSGLHFKCNDYGNDYINDYDIAFTGSGVTIGPIQGASGPDDTDPAGNTFTPNSNASLERHLYVDQVINNFIYWHHDPGSTTQIVRPESYTSPPILATWLLNSGLPYIDKENACPVDLSGMLLQGPEQAAQVASTELQVLEEVYADWRDGGDTEGLKEFILDPGNNSYALRNELMLLAPKVSAENWALVFERTPAMTAWHLAQALVANSPLEPSVLAMLDMLPIYDFYKELVYGGQSGVSMHSIYQSEIAHFYAKKTMALQAMVRKSLLSGDSADIALTRTRLAASKTVGEHQAQLALYLAEGDQTNARNLIDARLQGPGHLGYWQVQDLLLGLAEQNKGPAELDANGVDHLRGIAAAEQAGAAQAMAWLALLGEPTPEQVLLPAKSKRRKPQRERTTMSAEPMLAGYPTPTNGPAYLTYKVAVGVEHVELRVHDAQGRLYQARRVAAQDGIAELRLGDLPAGVMIANLYWDGIHVANTKLVVTR